MEKILREVAVLTGFDAGGAAVFEQLVDLHDYWDESHPAIDEDEFRMRSCARGPIPAPSLTASVHATEIDRQRANREEPDPCSDASPRSRVVGGTQSDENEMAIWQDRPLVDLSM